MHIRFPLFTTLLASSVSFLALTGTAAETTWESTQTKTRLLELYTSEGCSSCPPAEKWLSNLKNDARLWRDFAPIAFHVDYWDRLGWRDPYASKRWTARQYEYAAAWKTGSVYTPGFVLDGRQWRNSSAPPASNDEPGVLRISLAADNNMLTANFQPSTRIDRSVEVHVARLGFGLLTNVKAGENRGRKLEHDFVVLSLATEEMNNGKAQLRLAPAVQPEAAGSRKAIVAWVTEANSLEPIQAVGGWLP